MKLKSGIIKLKVIWKKVYNTNFLSLFNWKNKLTSTWLHHKPNMTESTHFIHFECELDDPSIGPKWTEWLEELEIFLTFVNISNDGRKIAALLHHAGQGIVKIYKTKQRKPLPNPLVLKGKDNVRLIAAEFLACIGRQRC